LEFCGHLNILLAAESSLIAALQSLGAKYILEMWDLHIAGPLQCRAPTILYRDGNISSSDGS
jgi:hypothetical protein